MIGLSMLAGAGLDHLIASGGPHQATAMEFILAAISFACASAGTALLIYGPKLLEPQQVSTRWHRHR